MAPFRGWADIPPELLWSVIDRLGLKCYAIARGVCTAWRRALAPPSPALLVVADGGQWRPHAASLPARRSFELTAVRSGCICVGSSNGWLALSVARPGRTVFVLLNPIDAVEIVLPPLTYNSWWVSKVVFAPNPTKEEFVAAAICDIDRIAYVTAGAKRWAVMDPVRFPFDDQLIDIVYTDSGKVYCLTRCGDVHLLRLPERHRREPAANADEAGPSKPEFPLVLLTPPRPKTPLHLMVRLRRQQDGYDYDPYVPESLGPHLNPPATVEPLLTKANLPFTPATVFGPSYNTISALTLAKNLVMCKGDLYQVWRNASCTVTFQLPEGGHRRILENETFVLRYNPQHRPCWDVVKDLGGYSFFVGRNNAVSMYAEGVPGLKGNSVYWIGGRGRDRGMVFDMATGRTASCQTPQVSLAPGQPQRTICWYFLSDVVSSRGTTGGRRVDHQNPTGAGAPSDLMKDLQE